MRLSASFGENHSSLLTFLFFRFFVVTPHLLEHFLRQTLAGVGQRRMIGGVFAKRDAQKLAEGQAVGTAPGDAALAIDALEIADQQHAKVDTGRNTGLATRLLLLVILHAAFFQPAVEAGFV